MFWLYLFCLFFNIFKSDLNKYTLSFPISRLNFILNPDYFTNKLRSFLLTLLHILNLIIKITNFTIESRSLTLSINKLQIQRISKFQLHFRHILQFFKTPSLSNCLAIIQNLLQQLWNIINFLIYLFTITLVLSCFYLIFLLDSIGLWDILDLLD